MSAERDGGWGSEVMAVGGSHMLHAAIASLAVLAGCGGPAAALATSPGEGGSRCTVRSIDEVARDPMRYSEALFCGEVYIVAYERTARVLNAGEAPPLDDPTMLVTSATRGLLRDLSTTPSRFYIEARIDPQVQCFLPSESGEDCSPYLRPVSIHILLAHRRP